MPKKFTSRIILFSCLLLAVGCSRTSTLPTTSTGTMAPVPSPNASINPVATAPALAPIQQNLTLHSVGQITWHVSGFIGKTVRMQGYVLQKQNGYLIFSDEAGGDITVHDLPISGAGQDQMLLKQKYEVQGVFMDHGLTASNGSKYHLELTAQPVSVK